MEKLVHTPQYMHSNPNFLTQSRIPNPIPQNSISTQSLHVISLPFSLSDIGFSFQRIFTIEGFVFCNESPPPMASVHLCLNLIAVFSVLLLLSVTPSLCDDDRTGELSIIGFDEFTFHGDYSPPSPPPPALPPQPPSLSCEGGLRGVGSLDSICELNSSLIFEEDVYIEGKGSLHILQGVNLSCPVTGCSIAFNMSREFCLGRNAFIVAGSVYVGAWNVSLIEGSVINTTALAGAPPAQTSGSPTEDQGSGGGHGGRGASCVVDNMKLPDDVWGGDAYSWSTLDEPSSYGSKGGTTSKGENYGGEGGGRIRMEVNGTVEVGGSLLADGGNGGTKGGGGSGGSIFIKAQRM